MTRGEYRRRVDAGRALAGLPAKKWDATPVRWRVERGQEAEPAVDRWADYLVRDTADPWRKPRDARFAW